MSGREEHAGGEVDRGLKHRATAGTAWGAAALCALAGAAVFQWFGNANHGYIDTGSLFWWWGFQWFNPQSETQHGLLVLALSLALLVRNLKQQARGEGLEARAGRVEQEARKPEEEEGSALASSLVALACGLGLHALGFAAQQARISILALLLFTWGVLRLGGGRRWGAAAAFPLAFLVFAIPLNALDSVGFWLRLWVIQASTAIAHAVGLAVIQNGTQLTAPDGRYQYDVAAACSGIRSLMALAALALLIGYLNFRAWWRRGLLLLLCFPLVYLGNVARIGAIILAAQAGGPKWGDVAHAVMGWAIFAIVLGGVVGAAAVLRRFFPECSAGSPYPAGIGSGKGTEAGCGDPALQTNRTAGCGDPALPRIRRRRRGWGIKPALARQTPYIVAVLGVVLAAGEMLFLHHLATRPEAGRVGVALAADGRNPVELPALLGHDWVGLPAPVTAIEREILPPDTGYSRMQYVPTGGGPPVFLSLVLSGRDRTSIHRPELCLVGQGWTLRGSAGHRFTYPDDGDAGFDATVLRVGRREPGPGGRREVSQLVAYWFVNGDGVVATHWERLARDGWNRLGHGRADRWAYVLMQTEAGDGEAAALARMQRVLNATLPVFQRVHPKKS